MDVKHTPGPWFDEWDDGETFGDMVASRLSTMLCDRNLNTKADAALIARAPELLEENKKLKARIAELEAEREWQPIETAPKDGSPFIGYNPEYGWVGTVRFDLPDDPDPEIGSPTLAFFGTTVRCTHWMTLPEMEDE